MKFKREDFKLWAVSLAYAAILLLCGCATVKESLTVDRSDRPWTGKPVVEESLAANQRLFVIQKADANVVSLVSPPKTFPILCDTQPCAIIGLRWGLERSVDLKVWQLVSNVPASPTGGKVAFLGTNDQPRAFYRVRTVWPP